MKLAIVILALSTLAAFAQGPEPQLSTAERTALQALEQQKQAAQKQFTDAQQAELSVELEFSIAHAGYHINAQTLAVEKDVPLAKAPPPVKQH